MADEDVTPQPPPPPRREQRGGRAPRRERPTESQLSPEAEAYLDRILPRLAHERFEIDWDERGFDCTAKRSRWEWSKFGFVDYTITFVEFKRIGPRQVRTFSADAFRFAESRGGMALPGIQGARFCFPVALFWEDDGAIPVVSEETPPPHFASFEFPCLYDLQYGELHFYQRTPFFGWAYYSGMRNLAKRWFQA